MKKLVVFLILAAGLFAVLVSAVLAEDKSPMSDLKTFLSHQERVIGGYCEGVPVYAEGYFQVENGVIVNNIYAFFDKKTAAKPFVVAFQNSATLSVTQVYIDFDKDGIVDFSGKPGDPKIGDDPCDALSRLQGEKQ